MIVWYQFKIQRWWRLVQTTFMTWFDDIDETLLERWEDAPWWKKNQQMSHWVNPTFWILFDGCRKTVFTGVENRFHSFLFLWHKSKMILFRDFLCPLCSINLCVRPLMDSTNKKCGPIFFAFYSRYSSRWSRLDSRLLGTMLEFLLWLIVHKNDEFVGKVKPSRVLTSATLILIVLDAEQRKSWYLSSWRSFRASWFFFMGSSSSSEYDLWFLLYFKQQPRWPCVFSTDP